MSLSFRRTLAPALISALALLALAVPAVAAPAGPSPLSAQPSAQDFGLVPVDWGEQNASVYVQNTGPDPVGVGSSTVDGDSALRINGDGCVGQQLASGQGCNVGVGFDPSDGVAYAATLHVPTAGFEDLDVPLSGTGGVQRVTLVPDALDFGAVAVGDGVVRSSTLTSTGNLSFQMIVAIPSRGDVGAFRVERDGCSLQELTTGMACDVAVRFAPHAAGTYDAALLLIGGNGQPQTVRLHGTAVAPPAPPAAAEPSAALAPPAPLADVAFDAEAGLPVPFARGRVQLGVARCVGAAQCTVVVRARVFALVHGRAAMRSASTDTVLWRVRASGDRVRIGLPARLRGTPTLLVARLRTHADGHAASTRTLVVPLVAGAPARPARSRAAR